MKRQAGSSATRRTASPRTASSGCCTRGRRWFVDNFKFFFKLSRKSSEGEKNAHFSSSLSSPSLDFLPYLYKKIKQARIITAAGGRAIAGPGVDVLDLMPTSYHGERRYLFFRFSSFRFFFRSALSFHLAVKKNSHLSPSLPLSLSFSLSLSLSPSLSPSLPLFKTQNRPLPRLPGLQGGRRRGRGVPGGGPGAPAGAEVI